MTVKRQWKPHHCQARAVHITLPFPIRSLTTSRKSDWFDTLVLIKSLEVGPYLLILLLLMMGCSVIACMSWLLERLIPRASLCPLRSITLTLLYSFGTLTVISASSNAITNVSEV